MTDEQWVVVDKVQGQLQAELLRGLLEAQDITVYLNQEGAAHAYAVAVGTLGLVEIMVPTSQVPKARQILTEYYRGDFNDIKFEESDPDKDL